MIDIKDILENYGKKSRKGEELKESISGFMRMLGNLSVAREY